MFYYTQQACSQKLLLGVLLYKGWTVKIVNFYNKIVNFLNKILDLFCKIVDFYLKGSTKPPGHGPAERMKSLVNNILLCVNSEKLSVYYYC